MQGLIEHNVTILMDKPNEMTNLNPTPQCSHQQTTLTAQGTTMKGLPHMSRTEHTVNEINMNKEHTNETNQDAHVSANTDHWIPISWDVTEVAMLSSDIDSNPGRKPWLHMM